MDQPSTWEAVMYGVLALLVILWFRPGIKASMARSQQAEKDWPAVLVPIALVVLFVVFLVAMV